MYLETIYILAGANGANGAGAAGTADNGEEKTVRAIDVGEYMGYSKPSVSRAMGLLKSGGFITVGPDGAISLTDCGRELAAKIYERHTLLTHFLTDIGVDSSTAAEDACKIEHVISDETFDALKRFHDASHR